LFRSVAEIVTPDEDLFALPDVGPPAVARVLLCGLLRRGKAGFRAAASSLPGHLIQLNLTGEAYHEVNGRRYVMTPGRLIWYHQDELVRVEVLKAPWSLLTLNFLAPTLAPPPFESRVHDVPDSVARLFFKLLAAWRDTAAPALVRELRVHAKLSDLLATLLLTLKGGQGYSMDPGAELWWRLESQLRRDLSVPISLKSMTRVSGRSVSTVTRSCKEALGVSPMKRMRQVRLSLARGLVQRSDLLFKEIAGRVGYARVHEFSRDYRREFACTPTADRASVRRRAD
jgi:AraC-like DNA-binding protein